MSIAKPESLPGSSCVSEQIARSLCRTAFLAGWSRRGIHSISPAVVAEEVEGRWQVFLPYVETTVAAVSDAISATGSVETLVRTCRQDSDAWLARQPSPID